MHKPEYKMPTEEEMEEERLREEAWARIQAREKERLIQQELRREAEARAPKLCHRRATRPKPRARPEGRTGSDQPQLRIEPATVRNRSCWTQSFNHMMVGVGQPDGDQLRSCDA